MSDEELLKICVMGSTEFKTSFIRRFAEGKVTTNYLPTLGVDITTKQIQIDNYNVKLIVVDTIGQELDSRLRPSYYRGAAAFIIIFDKGDRDSFNAVNEWYKEFRKHIPHPSVPVALVGIITKSEDVTSDEGQNLADALNTLYYEIPHSGKGFEQIFHDLTRKVLEKDS